MRVVIAPDKFKGSLSAPDVARHLEAGLQAAARDGGQISNLEVLRIPVADGGEGTLDAAVGSGFTRRSAVVSGPTGERIRAEFAVRGREAVIEMAAASGLAVLPGGAGGTGKGSSGGQPDSASAKGATSLGTGELIRAALDAGCRQIILGVGGSANTDGGAGVLQGLGARLLDADGSELPPGGAALARLAWIDFAGFDSRLDEARFVLASDVDNPLLGPEGAAAVFGPQKGATPAGRGNPSTPPSPTLWPCSRPRSAPGRFGPPRPLAQAQPAAWATLRSRRWPRPAGQVSTSFLNSPGLATGWPARTW